LSITDCLLANPIEDDLDRLIKRLSKVKDCNRDALAKHLATLVQAPDSLSVKEKVLMGLCGGGAFGYAPPEVRADARALLSEVDDVELNKFATLRNQA
jgi:hypothetical protein